MNRIYKKLRIISLIILIILMSLSLYKKCFAAVCINGVPAHWESWECTSITSFDTLDDLSSETTSSCTAESCSYPIVWTQKYIYNSALGTTKTVLRTILTEEAAASVLDSVVAKSAAKGIGTRMCYTAAGGASMITGVGETVILVGGIALTAYTLWDLGKELCQVEQTNYDYGSTSTNSKSYVNQYSNSIFNWSESSPQNCGGCTLSSVLQVRGNGQNGYIDVSAPGPNVNTQQYIHVSYTITGSPMNEAYNNSSGALDVAYGYSFDWTQINTDQSYWTSVTTPPIAPTVAEMKDYIRNHPELWKDLMPKLSDSLPEETSDESRITMPEPTTTTTSTDDPGTDTGDEDSTDDDTEKEEDEDLGTVTSPGYPVSPAFDTTMETPEKSDIGNLISEWLSNAPLISAFKEIHLQAQGDCIVTVVNPLGGTVEMNFCKYSSVWTAVNVLVTAIAYILAGIVMVRV